MTGAEAAGVATTRRRIPELATTGLVASWNGAIAGSDGKLVRGSLEEAGALARAAVDVGDDPVVLAVEQGSAPSGDGPLPWAVVRTVHLPSEAAAREYNARAFDNFEPSEKACAVTPEVFEVDPGEPVVGLAVAPVGLDAVDRRVGAAACAAAVPVPESVGRVRDALVQRLVSLESDSDGAPMDALRALLTDDPDDPKLMAAALDAATALDPGAPLGGRRFLSDVAETLEGGHPRTVKALDAALDVLKAKKELNPLRDEVGLRSVKALLLFALRPEPHDALAWSTEMPGDPLSVVAAATLSGLRSGWTRLPVTLRGPVDRRRWFESCLADSARSGDVVWSTGLHAVAGEVAAEPAEPDLEDGIASNVEGGGQLALDGRSPAKTAAVDDTLTTIRSLAAAADFDDPDIARAAAAVCLKHGWEELVTTVLEIGRRPYTWTGSAVEVVGAPVLRRRIDRTFIDRLDVFDGRMSAELKAFGAVLGAPPKPARRRKAT